MGMKRIIIISLSFILLLGNISVFAANGGEEGVVLGEGSFGELPNGNQTHVYEENVGGIDVEIEVSSVRNSHYDVTATVMNFGEVDVQLYLDIVGEEDLQLIKQNAMQFSLSGIEDYFTGFNVVDPDGVEDVEEEQENGEEPVEEPVEGACGQMGDRSGLFDLDLDNVNGQVELDSSIAEAIGAKRIMLNVNGSDGTIQVIHIFDDGSVVNNEDIVFMDDECNTHTIPYGSYGGGNFNQQGGIPFIPDAVVTSPQLDDEGVVDDGDDGIEEENDDSSILDGMLEREYVHVNDAVNVTVEESLLGRSYYVNTTRHYKVEEIPEFFELF